MTTGCSMWNWPKLDKQSASSAPVIHQPNLMMKAIFPPCGRSAITTSSVEIAKIRGGILGKKNAGENKKMKPLFSSTKRRNKVI